MSASAEQIAARYTQPGKQKVRQFVVDLAIASGCETALDLWGGGTSARALAQVGLKVVSAETKRAWWAALDDDAAGRYTPLHGSATRAPGTYDLVWFDSCSQASRQLGRELRSVAAKADRWLVVTLMPERETDKDLVMARTATIPAWLMVVTGLGLDYITRYVRNDYNQEMWLAVLSRRANDGRPQLHPIIVDRNLRHPHRRYWASNDFRRVFAGHLIPYASNMQSRAPAPRRCTSCRAVFTPRRNPRARWCAAPDCRRARDRHHGRAARTRRRVIYSTRSCVWCGSPFTPKRVDQKACPGTNHNALFNAKMWNRTHRRLGGRGASRYYLKAA